MKRQGGFTLIELVVVIVILGILAVTAAPRFLNLQDDARKASIQGLKGAIASAASIAYGGSAMEGEDTAQKTADAATTPQTNDGVATNFGYPTSATIAGTVLPGIETAVVGLPGSDWTRVNVTTTGVTPDAVAYSFAGTKTDKAENGYIFDAGDSTKNKGCFVIYIEAADAKTPALVTAVTEGC